MAPISTAITGDDISLSIGEGGVGSARQREPIFNSDEEVNQLDEFLQAMVTDSLNEIRSSGPDSVPSGLTLED